MGAPIAVPSGEGGGRDGVTNPAFQRRGIGGITDAAAIGQARGPSKARRVDLSEWGCRKSALHRPGRRWGAEGNPPPPIFESVEAAMAPPEESEKRWEMAEGTPLRRWKRLGDRKSPQSK